MTSKDISYSLTIPYNTNLFSLTPKTEYMINAIKESKHKSRRLANLNIKCPDDNKKDVEMPDIKQMTSICDFSISKYTILIELGSSI